MKQLPDPISSKNLRLSDIPKRFRTWSEIVEFAATFRPQDELPEGSRITGLPAITAESEITEIRSALFAEYRRYNHFGYKPEESMFNSAKNAIEFIRQKLRSEQGAADQLPARRELKSE